MGINPITLSIASTVASVAGGFVQMDAQRKQADFQAETAERNARRAVEDAQKATIDQGEKAAQQLGALVAQQSASGLSAGVGSSLLKRRAAERLSSRDNRRIREAGNLQAEGFTQEAANARAAGKNAALSGFLGIGSSLIGGAQSYNKVKRLQNGQQGLIT